jgi:excisionase family DNA binding protein
MNDTDTPRRIMTVAEVAEYLHVSLTTVHRLVRHGQIPFFRIGKGYRFQRDEIGKWVTDRAGEVLKTSGATVRAAPKKTGMAFARIPVNPSEDSACP